MKTNIKTLRDLFGSKRFQGFSSQKDNDFINHADRANGCLEASQWGGDGKTHCEVIKDWREYLISLSCFYPEYDEVGDKENYDIDQKTYELIEIEIDSCELWHIKNGSYKQIIN